MCDLARLAAVYGPGEQQLGLQRLIRDAEAGNLFLGGVEIWGKNVVLLKVTRGLCNPWQFRIRGLYTNSRCRQQGLATQLLRLAVATIFDQYHGQEVLSFIVPTNQASIAVHVKVGFVPVAIQPQPAHHCCYRLCRAGTDN